MADEASNERAAAADPAPDVAPPPATALHAKRRHRRWPWVLAAVVISPLVLFALWTVVALNVTFSSGQRTGYVQKFSRKGWVCKTWEGELAMVNVPGAMQEKWEFSVRNDSIAQVILRDMGGQVALTYDQHKGIPMSCFGETEYFISGVRKVGP